MNPNCGIYAITSPSGRQYIGQTKNFQERWLFHRSLLRRGKHHCRGLQKAHDKYGMDALCFSVVAIVPADELNVREQQEIDSRERRILYNSAISVASPMRGLTHSAEARAKISASKVGEKNPFWGRKHSAETLKKILDTRKVRSYPPRKLTEEHRARLLRTGIAHTAESRAKMSAAKRPPRSAEAIEKTASKLRGRPFSAEHKANISIGQRGKILTEEHKAKIRAAAPRGGSHNSSRSVICLDLNKKFGSVTEAAQFLMENGKPHAATSSISGACSGKHKSAYGYRWAYVEIGQVHAAGEVADKHFWKTPEVA
jgi:group I intron endonuclease